MKQDSLLIIAPPTLRPDPLFPAFEHRFCTLNGHRLHYVVGGEEGAPTILLLTGFPQSWFAWRHVIAHLSAKFRVIALDLPGQGDSDRPSAGYDTLTVAGEVKAFLNHIEVPCCSVVAHDIGAWVAFSLAASDPETVERLVLLDAGIPGVTLPDTLPVAADRAWRTWHFAFHVVDDLPEALITGRERVYLEWFLRRKTANPQTFSDHDIDEYVRVFAKDGGLRAGLAFYRDVGRSASQNRELVAQARLPMPVLAVGADQGSIADMAGPLRMFADNVTGYTISNCGHFIPEEQPEALADVLRSFLGEAHL